MEPAVLQFGKKVFHRLICPNPRCKKVFFRTAREVADGKDKFCSEACRYNLPNYNEKTLAHRPPKVNCVVCGTEISRAPSAAGAKTPYCRDFCRKLHQCATRAITQLIYTPDLLRQMMEDKGPWMCAFPGCPSLQARGQCPTFKNPFHACKLHRERIKNALKQRAKKRNRILRAHGLHNVNQQSEESG